MIKVLSVVLLATVTIAPVRSTAYATNAQTGSAVAVSIVEKDSFPAVDVAADGNEPATSQNEKDWVPFSELPLSEQIKRITALADKIFCETRPTKNTEVITVGDILTLVDRLSESKRMELTNRAFACAEEAAARAERAGYDGVQIHAAHFFYLSKFISPLFNHRNDRFGGSPENRARILVEILAAMRERTRPGFVVAIKVNSDDCQPRGVTLDDFLTAGRLLSDAGID